MNLRRKESSRRPEIDLALARANAASAATAAEQTTFVIDPLATPGKNVYNTLADATAASSSVAGPKTFEFRGASITIPGAAYNLGADPVVFRGQSQGTGLTNTCTRIIFQNGSTLTGGGSIDFDQLTLVSQSALPLITAGGTTTPVGVSNYRLLGPTTFQSNGAGPIIHAPAGALAQIECAGDGSGSVTGASPVFDAVGAGAFCVIIVNGNAGVQTNTLAQSAGGTLLLAATASSYFVSLTQAGMPGGLLVVNSNFLVQGTTSQMNGPGGNFPAIQAGSTALSNGVTAFIPATITATSRIIPALKTDSSGAATTRYAALSGQRVIGLAGAGGGFQITALNAAGINAADQSTLDWEVIN